MVLLVPETTEMECFNEDSDINHKEFLETLKQWLHAKFTHGECGDQKKQSEENSQVFKAVFVCTYINMVHKTEPRFLFLKKI